MIWRLLRRVISRQRRRDMGEFLRFRSPYSACAVRAKGGRSGARRFPVARNHDAVEMPPVLDRARPGPELNMVDDEDSDLDHLPFYSAMQATQRRTTHLHHHHAA